MERIRVRYQPFPHGGVSRLYTGKRQSRTPITHLRRGWTSLTVNHNGSARFPAVDLLSIKNSNRDIQRFEDEAEETECDTITMNVGADAVDYDDYDTTSNSREDLTSVSDEGLSKECSGNYPLYDDDVSLADYTGIVLPSWRSTSNSTTQTVKVHSPNKLITQQLQQPHKSTPTDHDRFKFSKAIGSGAFGKVFEATDQLQGGQKVAIKIVSLAQNKPQCALNEIKIMKSLSQHEYIVSYISSYLYRKQNAAQAYGSQLPVDEMAIVMEYCSNGSLMNKLMLLSHTSDMIPLRNRLDWYYQLSLAIEYIHSKGIVHRDIKPENILLDGKDQVKVADVGLAKAAFKLSSFSQSSGKSFGEYMMVSVKGTRPYMAPEIYAHSEYNQSCDVFSLGLVFWMIITLHSQCPEVIKGFGCKYLGELLNKIWPLYGADRQKPTDFLSVELGIDVLKEKTLIDKMLRQNPSDRIKMAEVVGLVSRLLGKQSGLSLTRPLSTINELSWQ